MTPRIRYHQVSAAALSLLLLTVPHSASSAAASAQFQMTIDGGHAFLKNGSQLVAGTVNYSEFHHGNYLYLEEGDAAAIAGVKYIEPAVKPVNGIDVRYWSIEGYKVTLCPDGDCSSTAEVTLPADTPEQMACDPGENMDNLLYIPSM